MKILSFVIIAGSLALAGCAANQEKVTTTTTTHTAATTNNSHVRVINGKRYVFVPAELGSNIPGRWVPENSAEAQMARQTGTLDSDTFRRTQDAPGQGLPGGN